MKTNLNTYFSRESFFIGIRIFDTGMCMYMNDMANLILTLSCIHVHVGIYCMLFWVCLLLHVLFCWPLGERGLRFIVRDSDNMTIIFWGESQLLSPHSVHILL